MSDTIYCYVAEMKEGKVYYLPCSDSMYVIKIGSGYLAFSVHTKQLSIVNNLISRFSVTLLKGQIND
jgi:hypothetical protein